MATSYSRRGSGGNDIADRDASSRTAVRWTFRTPPPKVLTFAPENVTVDTTPVFIATFDQRVDPAAVLKTHHARCAHGTKTAIRRATTAEVDRQRSRCTRSPRTRRKVVGSRSGRLDRLPNGAELTISIGPGTPSAEGPRTTTTASTHTATTYSALAVTDTQCGYGEGCRPGSGFTITFNNALDAKAFDSETVTIAPAVPRRSASQATCSPSTRATKSEHALRRAPPRIAARRIRPDARRDADRSRSTSVRRRRR